MEVQLPSGLQLLHQQNPQTRSRMPGARQWLVLKISGYKMGKASR